MSGTKIVKNRIFKTVHRPGGNYRRIINFLPKVIFSKSEIPILRYTNKGLSPTFIPYVHEILIVELHNMATLLDRART